MLHVRLLEDGGQEPLEVAWEVAGFLADAQATLDLALYDLRLTAGVAAPVRDALAHAVRRGVRVRLMHNVDHRGPIPVPRPSGWWPEALAGVEGIAVKSIPGIPDLMHHKCVVRDAGTPAGAVWTGSTNWTDDAWAREENVVVTVGSERVAAAYAAHLERLWRTEDVAAAVDAKPVPVDVGHAEVRTWFCPAQGPELSHRIARTIRRARHRVRACSPIVTSGPIVSTLCEVVAERRVDVAGLLDTTQMQEVLEQWALAGTSSWKIGAVLHLLREAPFAGKASTPWAPGSVHDYMHAKLVVADDVVFAGSYNLSHSGERNAEDVLEIRDAHLADRLAAWIDETAARYPFAELRDPRPGRRARHDWPARPGRHGQRGRR